MPVVNYYSHIPTIRIAEENRQLGPGFLWRLPFDAWNAQTAGAFEDHQSAFDRTAPVFFFLEVEVDWPFLVPGQLAKQSNFELKRPTHAMDEEFENLGFGFLTRFLETFGWTAQAALTLAAPAAAPGSPRSSMTICVPDEHYFKIQGNSVSLARIQGDADHEWLLLPEACGPPLPTSSIDLASAIWRFAEAARENDDLTRAVNALLLCAEPTLMPQDQLVVATVALEALLLPEVQSGLKTTFARRLAMLLSNSYDRIRVEQIARFLYDARSAALHGSEPKDLAVAQALQRACGAQQLLAASVLALGPSVLSGVPLAELREQLDAGSAPQQAIHASPLDLDSPTGLRTSDRLAHPTPTSAPYVLVQGGVMHAEEGVVASWSPLLGLACQETLGVREGGFAIVPLNAVELVEMEERDIARDFIADLRAYDALKIRSIEQIACIGLVDKGRYELPDLKRRRSIAVSVLRLAGFSEFIDPELLGWYIFEGTRRYRTPTVFRQSIVKTMSRPPNQRIAKTDLDRIEELAALLTTYSGDHSNEQVDESIGEFLRAHPNRFLPRQASAGLLLGVLEEVLGRFRPLRDAIQLEDLVSAAIGSTEAKWFRKRGRTFRNEVAHGRFSAHYTDDDLTALLATVRQIIEAYIRFWVELDDPSASPSKSFLAHLEAQIEPRRPMNP